MPSTYTTNLGIEKIATGEQSGTWGTTTNTNFDLIDTAVNGIVSITLSSAGNSGSPNDLPITDGTASNGRNKFIEFTDGGDLGATAYVQLTPNDAEKIVHIRNSLSGSRSIIVFQGTYNASNDFEIPNGADVTLKFDGGGTGATVTDVNVDLTVTGVTATSTASFSGATIDDLGTVTTADINGGTIDGTVIGGSSAAAGTFTTANATTVDTTNIEVTNIKAKDGTAAGSIADSTGVVTLASSVLTTADINGGTADAVVIGGSTAAAGTFTTFTSTGIDDNATSTAITIDSSEKVGIGETSPQGTLHVKSGDSTGTASSAGDELVVEHSSANGGISILAPNTSTSYLLFGDSDNNDVGAIGYAHSTNNLTFTVNASERMRIDSSGDVLVNTTTTLSTAALNAGTTGIALRSSDLAVISRDGGAGLIVNRKTSDGDLIVLRKDNTTVGSILSNGSNLQINGTGALELQENGTTRAYVESTGFHPWANNTYDIGTSSARWKDLYLSGGAYIGGTGAANHLDDYEEGTWTPTHGGNNMTGTAYYRKIGSAVMLHFDITSAAGSSASTRIGGLPFGVSGLHGTWQVGYQSTTTTHVGGYVDSTTSELTSVVQGGTSGVNLNAGERLIGFAYYTAT